MSTLLVHGRRPYNAEPPLDRLRASMITAAGDFYVRCHGDIPRLDAATHRLRVEGDVARPLDLSISELRHLAAERHVHAVLQCAGNRRADLQSVAPTAGDPWAPGAIGHALWTGVPLAAVLRHAGTESVGHVALGSADRFEIGDELGSFGVSIPLAKALDEDVLIAWAMNGEALLPEHGYPLRLIVPGYAGIRSAKWLTKITVQDHPSDNHMQQRDYRLVPADATPETVDWDCGVVIDEMPVNAAICEPARRARIRSGPTSIRGYAIATGRAITRVEVSIDGGRHWRQAMLEERVSAWSWTFWVCTVDIPPGPHELAVRAWDSAGQTQPSNLEDVWNFKGYLCTAWHRVPIEAA